MALAAAIASLNDPDQVANGKRLNSEAKTFVTSELDTMGYKQIPSQANFIMVDVKRPVVPLIQAMKQRNVQVGRLFPALPNHMRVTIGKKTEMESFLSTFRQIIGLIFRIRKPPRIAEPSLFLEPPGVFLPESNQSSIASAKYIALSFFDVHSTPDE